jgi:hypothetical protein
VVGNPPCRQLTRIAPANGGGDQRIQIGAQPREGRRPIARGRRTVQ